MTERRFKFRDLLAAPVLLLATMLDKLAIKIGGEWTAQMFLDQAKSVYEYLSQPK